MNSRRQWLNEATARLKAAGASDARLDAEWMLAHVLALPRLRVLVDLDAPVAEDMAEAYVALVTRRADGLPLQYVLGEAVFMGRPFVVDARVLIPRGDTEALCEAAMRRMGPEVRTVLDIGTGSGALAVSLALFRPDAAVTAVDISEDALAVARENAGRLGATVRFFQSDLFSALQGEVFDVIVSNPPYIARGELDSLQREVRHEPWLALDGGVSGLSFYRRIVDALSAHQAPGGSLLFEVGDGQAADVQALMRPHFQQIEIARDLAGLERVVAGDGYAG